MLTYHRVNPLRPGANSIETDLTIDPARFAAEMHALRRAGYHSVTQQQLFDALYRHARLPRKPVLISVDDGYVDDVRHILPVLRREHLKATFFVITGRFHQPGFMNAAQVRRLDLAGMDVGDHTRSHVDLRLVDAAHLRREVGASKRALARALGHPVYFFAYPFGALNARVVAGVRSAGFTMAFTTAAGSRESTAQPLMMPRLHIGRAVTPQSLISLLRGS
ncbi:MAG TPA: polysaccharide deacetylase family protein [Solirubrobacteraceae bacterium]|nr:polysaccharide deacetylase family protein [Solirubrobacteraceae bacterium]